MVRKFIYDPSLVLYVDFKKHDGNTFISDDAHGNLCTATGTTWGLQGRTFDGVANNIQITSHPSFAFTTEKFTISIWGKVTSLASDRSLISKGTTTDGFWSQWRSDGSIWITTNDDAGSEESSTATGLITPNNWYKITLFKNGSSCYVNINGLPVRMAVSVVHTDIGANTGNLYLGVFSFGGAAFPGMYGELAIWNRLLTPLEDQRNYLATKYKYT
jgi:hypothetical protein